MNMTEQNIDEKIKEEWKNIVVDGIVINAYSVSNYGNIVTHLHRMSTGKVICDPNYKKIKQQKIKYKKSKGDNDLEFPEGKYIQITFPSGIFKDYDYKRANKNPNNSTRYIAVHKLVMQAFKPVDEYPPIPLLDWINTPESAKQFIRHSVYIDHIDANPLNNIVTNLRYVTPRENSRAAVKHYGGNTANRIKQHENKMLELNENKISILNFCNDK